MAHYGRLPSIKNIGNAHKGIYVLSRNIVLTLVLGYMNLQQFVVCNRVGGVLNLVSLRISIMANPLAAKK